MTSRRVVRKRKQKECYVIVSLSSVHRPTLWPIVAIPKECAPKSTSQITRYRPTRQYAFAKRCSRPTYYFRVDFQVLGLGLRQQLTVTEDGRGQPFQLTHKITHYLNTDLALFSMYVCVCVVCVYMCVCVCVCVVSVCLCLYLCLCTRFFLNISNIC